MASGYDFTAIEAKWQRRWEEEKTFRAVDFSEKPKYFCLDMFPYPSGAGLHVGHPEGYTATDITPFSFSKCRLPKRFRPWGSEALLAREGL